MQLQEQSTEFIKMDVELIAVFREEKDGVEGMKKAEKNSSFPLILLDTPIEKTALYSQNDFATYLIDKKGIIKQVLSGTKGKRPTGEVVLGEAKKAFE